MVIVLEKRMNEERVSSVPLVFSDEKEHPDTAHSFRDHGKHLCYHWQSQMMTPAAVRSSHKCLCHLWAELDTGPGAAATELRNTQRT